MNVMPGSYQNPYIFDALSLAHQARKALKKKSESIDLSKKKPNMSVAAAAAGKLLRQS